MKKYAIEILVGVIIAVLAGVIVAVTTGDGPYGLRSPTPIATSLLPDNGTSNPPISAEVFKLVGTWEGTDSRGVLFRFIFEAKCDVGDVCGKVELPEVGCTAFPVLASIEGETYIFEETNHQNCLTATGHDTIKLLEDGTLLFGSNGQPPTIILYRK